MTRRLTTLLVLLALGGFACSPEPGSADESTTVTTPPAGPPPTMALAYDHPIGATVRYAVTVSQDIAFDATGNAPGFGDATLPIDADLVTESEGTMTYDVSDGSASETVRLALAARFPETRVAGTVNGSTVDNLEEGGVEADLARIDPVDAELTVDRLGAIVGEESADAVLGADLAALTGITNDLFSHPVGPVLSAEEVTVGDTWETRSVRSADGSTVEVRSESRIVGFEDGAFVIETTTVTDAFQVDFSTEFRALYRDIAEQETEGELPPEVLERLDTIQFVISVEESTTTETATFDPDLGLVTGSRKATILRLGMVFRAPDDSGTTTGFDITLDIAQSAVFTLVS